jgi:3-oxoacyl-[acyl-carrier-protein] synthase III
LPAVQITGVGALAPSQVVTNEDLMSVVATSDEWIASRTGIRQRRILRPDESLLDLAAQAAQAALVQAGRSALDIDLLILATSTPEDLFGSATRLQKELGAVRAVGMDLTAACSGFVFAVATGSQFIRTGTFKTVLIVAADGLSRWTNWEDRATCILFGDGAGAVVLEAGETEGILGFELRSDGSGVQQLTLENQCQAVPFPNNFAVARNQYQHIYMNGREVYRFAVGAVPDLIEKTLAIHDVAPSAVKGYFLHQANQRILDAVANRLQIPKESVASNIARYGNTSSASVPLILEEWVRADRLQPGDLMVMAGFGAGLSWGAILARWGRI